MTDPDISCIVRYDDDRSIEGSDRSDILTKFVSSTPNFGLKLGNAAETAEASAWRLITFKPKRNEAIRFARIYDAEVISVHGSSIVDVHYTK